MATDMSTTDILGELSKGTSAHLVSDTSKGVLHDRPKIETPVPQLNCILGGGIPLGVIVEAFGDPASGKSSTMYCMMGNFQRQYPNGIGIIVDTEASIDSERMPFLGVNPEKVLRIPATTIEEGFSQVYKILDKKASNPDFRDIPVFILWDTIGINPTNREMESDNAYAEGMMGHAKLLKHQLSKLFPRIEEHPIIVVLLNQVITQTDRYGNAKLGSGGGWGVKHNAHLRLSFHSQDDIMDDIFVVAKNSVIDLEKSKLSPLFYDISFTIDVTKGGVVDPIRSMLNYSRNQLGYITKEAWAKFDRVYDLHPEYDGKFDKFSKDGKSFRWSELVEYAQSRPKIITLLQLCFLDEICEKYSYQAAICEPYRQKLLQMMEEPEPYDDGNGHIVDRWTGEIIEESSKIDTIMDNLSMKSEDSEQTETQA